MPMPTRNNKLPAFVEKMETAGLAPTVIETFSHYYRQIVAGETGSASGSVVLHAEIATAKTRASKRRHVVFIFFPPGIILKNCKTDSVPSLPDNGRPRRFSYVTFIQYQPLTNIAINRNRGKHSLRTFAGSIKNHAAVRCETG